MGENDNDTYANINRANYDFDDEAFTDISDEAKDFISKLLIKDKEYEKFRNSIKDFFSFFFSQRLSAKQCLAHPWLTRRPRSISNTTDEETAEKKLSTKKLRRFVIRRRWQVKFISF
jgi:myosin-light-chain kinase